MKILRQLLLVTLFSLGGLGFLSLSACTSTQHQESTGQYIDSAAITTKVKAELAADKTISSLPITVNTYKSVVQLSGFVRSHHQKARAEQIARSVSGVRSVQNSLIVK